MKKLIKWFLSFFKKKEEQKKEVPEKTEVVKDLKDLIGESQKKAEPVKEEEVKEDPVVKKEEKPKRKYNKRKPTQK